MAIFNTTNKTTVEHNIEVTRAVSIDDKTIAFDMIVNGVTIYGCILRAYTNAMKENKTMVTFPSRKSDKTDENGKPIYYSHCWLPLSKADRATIEAQIETILK